MTTQLGYVNYFRQQPSTSILCNLKVAFPQLAKSLLTCSKVPRTRAALTPDLLVIRPNTLAPSP